MPVAIDSGTGLQIALISRQSPFDWSGLGRDRSWTGRFHFEQLIYGLLMVGCQHQLLA